MTPAVFLDRDGTLNVDHDYVHRADQWEWIPGAVEAVRGFNRLGFKVVVVTNQSGVGRGLYAVEDVEKLHAFVRAALEKAGARVDAFHFCPHLPDAGCDCRKPKPEMLFRATRELDVDLSRSYMIGDKGLDVAAARAAGVTPVFVLTGHGEKERGALPPGTVVVKDVLEAQRWIVEREKNSRRP